MPESAFGSYLRQKRLDRKLTLRFFCERYGFDSAYISRLENNKLKPPATDKLASIAKAIGLEKNSSEWTKFFDLAHLARNQFPADIKVEAAAAISLLPMFLRTKDGSKVSKKKVEKLIEFLEKDGKE